MNDIIGVHVNDGHEGLREKLESLGLWEDVFAVLVVKEIAHLCVLHDHVNVLSVVERVPYLNDMRVVHLWVQLYLAFYEFDLWLGRKVG